MAITCWASDCNHNNLRETCTFYRFPKNIILYRKWLTLLRRDAEPGTGARVCSCHFRDEKKENLPEIFKRNKEKLFGKHYLSPERKKSRRKLSEMYEYAKSDPETENTITASSMESQSIPIVVAASTSYGEAHTSESQHPLNLLSSETTSLEAAVEVVIDEPLDADTTIQDIECEATQIWEENSFERNVDSDWSHYVPWKLKVPVSRNLMSTAPNPFNTVKAECYAMKLQYLKGEVEAQKQRYEMALRQEKREIERHAIKMKKLDLEIKKLANEN